MNSSIIRTPAIAENKRKLGRRHAEAARLESAAQAASEGSAEAKRKIGSFRRSSKASV